MGQLHLRFPINNLKRREIVGVFNCFQKEVLLCCLSFPYRLKEGVTMYAIIKTGGKQYRVAKGEVIDIERIEGEPGSAVEFGEVLLVAGGSKIRIGEPHIANCLVKGELVEEIKGPKIDSVKYKERKRQIRHWGHRQRYSRVKITEIAI
jgi:large subunit ribosomal protein L21